MKSFRAATIMKIFFRLIEEVVAGQMIDVSLMVRNEVTTADILKKNELKTALYSFVNPMLIGAALASPHGTPSSRVAFYRELGLALGNAFQIQDDLLDIIGTHDTTGKMPFIDVHDGQHTILSQYIFDHAEARDKEVFMSLFGKPVDAHGQKVLARLFESTGAIAHAEKEIAQLFSKAYALIADASMKKPQKEAWLHFVGKLDKRTS